MSLLGKSLVQMLTKYDFEFSKEAVAKNLVRLTNQTWKLIPMFENNEDWNKQINTVIIEIAGLKEIFFDDPHFLQLLSKLEGLRITEVDFSEFRKTIFEVLGLLQEIKHEISV